MTGTKRVFALLVLTIVLLVVQESLLGLLLPRWLVPNLVLLIAVFLGLKDASVTGAVLAFVLGLLGDLVSAQSIGPLAGASVAIFGIFAQVGKRLLVDNALAAVIIAGGGSLIGNLLCALLLDQFAVEFNGEFFKALLGMSFAAAVCSPVIFALLERYTVRKTHPLIGRYF